MATTQLLKRLRAQAALKFAEESSLSPKDHVLIAEPEARLDYYESLRKSGKPCWFIRHGFQAKIYTPICANPRAAWKAAYDDLLAAIRKAAA